MIQESDYPALYSAADRSAKRLQRRHFNVLGFNLLCLTLTATMSAFPLLEAGWWIAAGLVNIAVILATLWTVWERPQSKWYETRAIAESVKTISWRFALRAKPFNGADNVARATFKDRLRRILEEHRGLAAELTPSTGVEQITPEMEHLRLQSVADRLARYLERRVDEQAIWYATRAAQHRKKLARWIGIFVLLLLISMALLFWRATNPKGEVAVVDVVVGLAFSVLAWLQAKRFPETVASYSLTAHEIGLIRASAGDVVDENSLSKFVAEAENAFSREHTQWIARLDS